MVFDKLSKCNTISECFHVFDVKEIESIPERIDHASAIKVFDSILGNTNRASDVKEIEAILGRIDL